MLPCIIVTGQCFVFLGESRSSCISEAAALEFEISETVINLFLLGVEMIHFLCKLLQAGGLKLSLVIIQGV